MDSYKAWGLLNEYSLPNAMIMTRNRTRNRIGLFLAGIGIGLLFAVEFMLCYTEFDLIKWSVIIRLSKYKNIIKSNRTKKDKMIK